MVESLSNLFLPRPPGERRFFLKRAMLAEDARPGHSSRRRRCLAAKCGSFGFAVSQITSAVSQITKLCEG